MSEEKTVDLSNQIQYVDLVIFCESAVTGYTREVIDLVKDINRNFQARGGKMVLNLMGILSKDKSLIGQSYSGIAVLGDYSFVDEYTKQSQGVPVNGIVGEEVSSVRQAIAEYLLSHGGVSFPSIVHPTVVAGSDVKLGKGNILLAGSSISTGTDIADFCLVGPLCTIRPDCKIKSFSNILPYTYLVEKSEV